VSRWFGSQSPEAGQPCFSANHNGAAHHQNKTGSQKVIRTKESGKRVIFSFSTNQNGAAHQQRKKWVKFPLHFLRLGASVLFE